MPRAEWERQYHGRDDRAGPSLIERTHVTLASFLLCQRRSSEIQLKGRKTAGNIFCLFEEPLSGLLAFLQLNAVGRLTLSCLRIPSTPSGSLLSKASKFIVENGSGAVDTPNEAGEIEDDYRIGPPGSRHQAMRDAIL